MEAEGIDTPRWKVSKVGGFELPMVLVQADEVIRIDGGTTDLRCLCCRREIRLERIVVLKQRTVGRTEVDGQQFAAGVCAECIATTSEDRAASVVALTQAASRVDALLSLVRHRAELQLASWWGSVGTCTTDEIDAALVALRRAIERLGVKP